MEQTGTNNDGIYRILQQHLDRQAIGFPKTGSGADIRFLKTMFAPDEARVALALSYQPTRQDAVVAATAGIFSADQTIALLERAFQKGAIGWKNREGAPHWFVMPLVIGMLEAQDGNPSREFLEASDAYSRTMEYGKSFLSVKPSQMRTIPINKSVTVEHHIATYDEIRSLVLASKGPFVALKCICREMQAMRGHRCQKTSRLETCLGMGDLASMVLRRNHGREISADDAITLLGQNEDEGLVLQPANAQKADFVCSCCGCCCGMLRFQKMLPRPIDFWSSNFFARLDHAACSKCGACVKRCQVGAVSLDKNKVAAEIDLCKCIGCGLCVPTCPKKTMRLIKKPMETVPPRDDEDLCTAIGANKKKLPAQLLMLLKLALKIPQ